MPGEIVIVSAARTAVGSFNGAFAATPAHELGAAAIKAALAGAEVDAGEVDEVILGQVLTANQGQNPARQAAIKAGIPQDKTAFGLNQVCGSGLRAVALGMQQIANGDAKIVVAGGQESMSLSQHGDNRMFLEAVLWMARVGAPWRDLPETFGNGNSVFQRFRRWAQKGNLKQYRRIATRYDKTDQSFKAMINLAVTVMALK